MGGNLLFCQNQILGKIGIFSGKHRSIDEWCYEYDEVDLGLTWGVIKYLHWKTKWSMTNPMIGDDFLEFWLWCFKDFEIWYFGEII